MPRLKGFSMTGRYLTPALVNTFEAGGNRKTAWTTAIAGGTSIPAGFTPAKYKINSTNYAFGGYRPSEYYVVMKLAKCADRGRKRICCGAEAIKMP